MDFAFSDFNGADQVLAGASAAQWVELESLLSHLPLFLQASDQAGKVGVPIFDPKATNRFLTDGAAAVGWKVIPVPGPLVMFGKDWDGGKGATLAEWQFSNYPFLWNNVIRSEAVFKSKVELPGLQPIEALVVVTKGGMFPASNSTLYYEQACAQVAAVVDYDTFSIPIRVVGLMIPEGTAEVEAVWSVYPGRYSRANESSVPRRFPVEWGRKSQYGVRSARFGEPR